jgi:hypothetical protein
MMHSEDVAAIKELVGAQFRSLAWTRDEDADWAAFAQGFFPGATLFPAARPVKPQTVEPVRRPHEATTIESKLVSSRRHPSVAR